MIFSEKKLEQVVRESVHVAIEEHKVAEDIVDDMYDCEVERRKWCLDQATYLDDIKLADLFNAADKIYEYVWGANPANEQRR